MDPTRNYYEACRKKSLEKSGPYKVVFVCYLTSSGKRQNQVGFVSPMEQDIRIDEATGEIHKNLRLPLIDVSTYPTKKMAIEDARKYCPVVYDWTKDGWNEIHDEKREV